MSGCTFLLQVFHPELPQVFAPLQLSPLAQPEDRSAWEWGTRDQYGSNHDGNFKSKWVMCFGFSGWYSNTRRDHMNADIELRPFLMLYSLPVGAIPFSICGECGLIPFIYCTRSDIPLCHALLRDKAGYRLHLDWTSLTIVNGPTNIYRLEKIWKEIW